MDWLSEHFGMVATVGGIGIGLGVLGALVLVMRCRKSCPPQQALVVYHSRLQPRISFSGAVVVPPMMKAAFVDLSPKVLRLNVTGANGAHCADYQKVDIVVSYQLRVGADERGTAFIDRFQPENSFHAW